MALLTWKSPSGFRKHVLDGTARLGRSDDNDIVLDDDRVSKYHARLVRRSGEWIFEDLGSTNGSFVNGERRAAVALDDCDLILLGHTELIFYETGTPGTPATNPGGRTGVARTPFTRTEMVRIEDLLPQAPPVSRLASLRAADSAVSRWEDAAEDRAAALRRLKVCYDISEATAATHDLPSILDRVLSVLFENFSMADRAFILLVDPETQLVRTAAERRRTEDDSDNTAVSRTVLEDAMREREAILCLDAASDDRYATARSIVALGIRSLVVAPLVFGDQVLGAIQVDTRRAEQFAEADLRLLSAAASQVAARVANALLHEKVVASERLAAVGQTVAGLTHCIKNILQGVKGGAFIVEKALKTGNTDKLNSGWDMVRRNNAFMEQLVFDLLTISKKRAPEYETTDLNALCRDVCEMAAVRGSEKNVPVTFSGDDAIPPVEADPNGIRRCLLNLVTNAIDACEGADGSVTVRACAPRGDGLARILVEDTGCGMSDEQKARLFAVFFSTKGSKGTGLGLPVTRKIVEEHDGRIEVDSREGEGTTFTIVLPVTRPQTEAKGADDDGSGEEGPDS